MDMYTFILLFFNRIGETKYNIMMNLKHLFLTLRKEMKANENLLTEKSNIFIIIGPCLLLRILTLESNNDAVSKIIWLSQLRLVVITLIGLDIDGKLFQFSHTTKALGTIGYFVESIHTFSKTLYSRTFHTITNESRENRKLKWTC